MKKLLLSLFVVAMAANTNAQLKTPAPSPSSKLEQTVGLTDVSVEYSRPGMKGRTIFGDLVPYGKVWRTGANENTKITFSDDVTIDGKELKKGTYALFTKPGKETWEVIFYTDSKNWGAPRSWDDAKVALSTTAKVMKMPMKIETFTITIDDLASDSAVLGMLWENDYVGVKFNTPTDKGVEASIAKVMSGPSANDYFDAAGYYYDQNKDINKAKTWIDKAIELTKEKPRFWYIHKQALIHKKAGNKASAKKAAMLSLKLAKEAKYDAYIKKNEDLLKTL
ncbi:MAG: DUF2911 domain-containing protein [Tenacibaculum sp.]